MVLIVVEEVLILDLEEQEEVAHEALVELPEITSSDEEEVDEYDHVIEVEVERLVEVRSIWS